MSLSSLFEWGQEQVKYLLFIVAFVALIITAYKRAWITMIGVIIGLAVISIFIVNPDILVDIGSWLSDLLSLGEG